jgi:hypothetical protein
MAHRREHDEHALESSELDPNVRSGANYAPTIKLQLPAGLGNGNFKWVVILLLGVLTSTFAYLWVTKDQRDEKKDDRISTLEGWKQRVDERLDWMQKEIEQNRK